jgi:hypothetical protein
MTTNEQALAEFQYGLNHWFKFMDAETRAKAAALVPSALTIPMVKVQNVPSPPVSPSKDTPTVLASPGPGRGKAAVGTAWLLNRETGERARVSNGEVENYLARGFIKAGPRTR